MTDPGTAPHQDRIRAAEKRLEGTRHDAHRHTNPQRYATTMGLIYVGDCIRYLAEVVWEAARR
jgi:hypothetical protein